MKNKNNNGFTLIEIMLAVAVLSIIVVSFSGAFSSGFRSIQQSRNEITNLNESQSDLEEKIATEAFDRAKTLNLDFNNQQSIEVPGAIVEKNDVRTFLPDVPVIKSVNLTPDSHIYGLEQKEWNVEIKTRGVEDNSPITVSVYQQNDADTVLISNTENKIVDESAEFKIPIPTEKESRLTDDLYYFRFEVEGVNGELDKYYTVRGINYLAPGESTDGNKKLLASSDHKRWGILKAEKAEISTSIDFDNLKAGTWGGEVDDRKFIIVGDGGKAYSSNDGVYWKDISAGVKVDDEGKQFSYDFKDVIWDGNSFIGAGQVNYYDVNKNDEAFIIKYNSTGWSNNLISAGNNTSVNKLLFIEDGIDGSSSVVLAAGELDNGSSKNMLFYSIDDEWKTLDIGESQSSNIVEMLYDNEDDKLFIIEKHLINSKISSTLLNYPLEYNLSKNKIIINPFDNSKTTRSVVFNTVSEFQDTKFVFGNSGSAIFHDSDNNNWDNFDNINDSRIPDFPSSSNFSSNDSIKIENDLLILGEKDSGGSSISEMYLLEYNYEDNNFSWNSLSDLSLLDSGAAPLYDFENDFPYSIIDIISK